MTRWADRTYWVKVDDSWQAIVCDDDLGDLDYFLESILASEFEPCRGCDKLDACMDSLWNEGLRMGGPDNKSIISIVHTCNVCGKKVLNLQSESYGIPDQCPRWNPVHSSARSCKSCRLEYDALMEDSPYHKQRETALDESLAKLKDALGCQQDELGAARICRESAELVADAVMPRFDKFPAESVIKAQWIVGSLVQDIEKRFASYWYEEDDIQRHFQMGEWLEIICVALGRYDDVERITHSFLLAFVHGRFSVAWSEKNPAEKKFILRVWEGIVREALSNAQVG